jgi:hypothetical protein
VKEVGLAEAGETALVEYILEMLELYRRESAHSKTKIQRVLLTVRANCRTSRSMFGGASCRVARGRELTSEIASIPRSAKFRRIPMMNSE